MAGEIEIKAYAAESWARLVYSVNTGHYVISKMVFCTGQDKTRSEIKITHDKIL